MRKASHLHTRPSTLKIEDEKFIIIVIGSVLFWLIMTGGTL